MAALANCPDLESLELARGGTVGLDDRQVNCDAVVKLCRLQRLYLKFNDPPAVRYLLSHIECPESTRVRLSVAVGWDVDISDIIYQVLPRGNTDTIQYFRKTQTLTAYLGDDTYTFSAEGSTIHCHNQRVYYPQALSQFASEFLEVVGGNTLTLFVGRGCHELTERVWEAVLRGLPRLERLNYQTYQGKRDRVVIDPFISVFSQAYQAALVLPQLQHLELPRDLITHGPSATLLKHALEERIAWGRRLKRIGLSDDEAEEADGLVLGPFLDVVDDVQYRTPG